MRQELMHCEVCLDGLRGNVELPTMQQLRYFLHVCGSESFAAAAREMRVAPHAVRHGINSFEQLVGMRLFERRKRSVRMLPSARMFLPHVQRIIYLASMMGRPYQHDHDEIG